MHKHRCIYIYIHTYIYVVISDLQHTECLNLAEAR